MCQRWLLLLIPLFIPAGTTTLDEEAALTLSSKIEEIVPGDPDNSNNHQLFKRRFAGYKDFNKYKFSKSKGRIHTIFLRNPYDTLLRSKRSNSVMLRMLNTLFVKRSDERIDPEQIHLPVPIRGKARGTESSEYDDSKEDALNNNVLKRIDKTLTRLDNKLKAMEKDKENAFIMFKVPVPIDDYDRKSRTKREANEPEDRHDDDSDITVIARTKPNKHKTTTKPNTVSEIEEKVENISNSTIARNGIDKKDYASIIEPIDTNKTEAINNEEIDNKTLSVANKTNAINNEELDNKTDAINNEEVYNKTLTLAELRNYTRKFSKPEDKDYFILKMEEVLDDIHIKLSPLKRIKDKHSKDEEYKIGYIIANLESAQETIEKLLNKLKTRDPLPRDQAQDILDKVTLSSMVVSNLMNFLGRYSNSPATPTTPVSDPATPENIEK